VKVISEKNKQWKTHRSFEPHVVIEVLNALATPIKHQP
jgi:hypothetical protein